MSKSIDTGAFVICNLQMTFERDHEFLLILMALKMITVYFLNFLVAQKDLAIVNYFKKNLHYIIVM